MPFPRTVVYRAGLSAASGAVLSLCFPNAEISFLVWVGIVPLLVVVLEESRLPRAFLWGYLAGVVFFLSSCYWITGVVHRYGGLPRLWAVGVLLLMALVLAGFYGAFGFAVGWVARRSRFLALASAPALWVALEFARTYLITGFPWNLAGYAVADLGLRQLAAVTGVYGLSFLALATNAWIAAGVSLPFRKVKWMAIAWLCVLALADGVFMPPAQGEPRGTARAYLVQPDVPLPGDDPKQPGKAPEYQDWRQIFQMTVQRVRRDSHREAPLVVWPESSAPFYFHRDVEFRRWVTSWAQDAHAYLLLGTVNFTDESPPKPRNSAVLISPRGELRLEYDKIHLVPFGEYVPAWAFPDKIGKITSEAGNFQPGRNFPVGRTDQGRLGVFICYEAIFPGLVRQFALQGAEVLINISNDAWFGESSAPAQHLAMARLRAIENRRYLLRAANNGITAVVDPYGRVVKRAPQFHSTLLVGKFDYNGEQSLYTRHGDIFAWFCCLASLAALLAGFAQSRPLQETNS